MYTLFAPSRGRELKSCPPDVPEDECLVRPLAGAGIEMAKRRLPRPGCIRFAPSRGRELKYPQKRHIQHGCKFAPSWG